MTRGEFDADMGGWEERVDAPEPREDEDNDLDLLPPDLLNGQIQNVQDAEKNLLPRHPGDARAGKSTDPDDWHH
ncbi:MAG TPA: hypothetical protein VF669_06175 [Tepidisphaeraceae bacterium]|jgi:hypothetical protein